MRVIKKAPRSMMGAAGVSGALKVGTLKGVGMAKVRVPPLKTGSPSARLRLRKLALKML